MDQPENPVDRAEGPVLPNAPQGFVLRVALRFRDNLGDNLQKLMIFRDFSKMLVKFRVPGDILGMIYKFPVVQPESPVVQTT